LSPQEFTKWKQKRLLGVSLKVIGPTGQYQPEKLTKLGHQPAGVQAGVWLFGTLGPLGSRWLRRGWFYTINPAFYSSPIPKQQAKTPILSFEGHLSYDFKARAWVSLDGNFWSGGTTSLNGVQNPDTRQTSSRIGSTGSIPLSKHQSVKISYSNGTYIRFGGNYQNLTIAWQYSWAGRPQ
jgi:hypothetical protein